MWIVLTIIAAIVGVIPDGLLTGISFLDLIEANNLFAKVLGVAGGFIVTLFVAFHKQILEVKSPLLVILFVIAVLIDLYTTYYGVKKHVAGDTVIAFGLLVLINGLTLFFSEGIEKLQD